MCSRVIVYGGRGALGAKCVELLKKNNAWVVSIDLASNELADCNVLIKNLSSWNDQHTEVSDAVNQAIGDNKVDAIICVAGGWAGGNAENEKFVANSDLMWKQSVWSSTIASSLASKHLHDGGLLTLTGAFAATEGTAGMMGYGMAKAAVHQLCKSLAQKSSGLPDNASALCILPVTLDTPMNRKGMPNADFSSWTSLDYVSKYTVDFTAGSRHHVISTLGKQAVNHMIYTLGLLVSWIKSERPPSGSLLKLETKNNETNLVSV